MRLQSPYKKPSTSVLSFPTLFQSSDSQENSYYDLNRFREELNTKGICPKTQLYHHHKKAAWLYRSIFFGIAALFFTLLITMYFQKTSWFVLTYFSQHVMAKIFACTICGSLGIGSFLIGLSIKAEKESVSQLFRSFRSKLFRVYMRKRMLLGWKQIVAFVHHASDGISQDYDHALEGLNEKREGALNLMKQIRQSRNLDVATRENLFTQALSELQDDLHAITQAFHDKAHP